MVGKIVCGHVTSNSYILFPKQLLILAQPTNNIVSTFTHPQSLDVSLLAPPTVTFADIQQVLSSLKVHWEFLHCQSITLVKGFRNYLLTIIWPKNSTQVETDKLLLLKTLRDELAITSKS